MQIRRYTKEVKRYRSVKDEAKIRALFNLHIEYL